MASKADSADLTLKEICGVLGTFSHKWWKIGVQLGVPYHVLEEFKKENDPLTAVINYWLKGNAEDVPVCWESIVTALKSSHVREQGLAVKITAKYCPQLSTSSSTQEDKGANTHPYSESVAVSKVSSKTSSGSSSQLSEVELQPYFPYLKDVCEREKEENKMMLQEQSKKLREKFTGLVHDFKLSLKESTHKLEDIIGIIKYYVNDEELAEIEELLSSCKTVGEVFDKLRGYTSFFNFDIIKVLISKLGSSPIKDELKEYRKKFHDYCKYRICECPKDAFSDDKKETKNKYVLKTELKMTDNLKKLEQLRYSMNVILGRKFLRLLHVDEGCVKLTFRVLIGLSSSLTEEQQQLLRDNGVLHLSYGDQQYDISHLNPTKTLRKIDNLSSADSAYISGATLNSTVTTESNDINPTEELQKSAEPITVESRADLHEIINIADIDLLKVAIKRKEYNPLSKDVYGYTALHTAAKHGKLKVMKYLIEEEGINPSIPGPQGATPLNVAAETGNLSIVKYLIEDQHVDPSADKDKDGYLPLHRACFTNKIKLVKYLFQKMKEVCYMENKDILCEFTKHDTAPLHIATLHGHLDIVKFFTEECECDPNLSNKAGRTALFFACENGSLEMVQYLVEVHFCQPSAKDKGNNTLLHLAAQHGSLSIVQYLIGEKNCDTKCKNHQGNTPLLEASFGGMLDVVKYLIKLGYDPNIKSTRGYNCLHAACCCGHLEVIRYLIEEQHMNPNIPTWKTNAEGQEPNGQSIVEEGKLDQNSTINDYTPLHLAAMHDRLNVLKYLAKMTPYSLHITTSRNETALSLALAKGNQNIIKYLLKVTDFKNHNNIYCLLTTFGILDIIREHKREILHHISLNEFDVPLIFYAAAYGHLDIVKYFIEEDIYKADCMHCFGLNFTPLHLAAFSGQIEIFKYLIKECKCDSKCRASTNQNNEDFNFRLGSTPLHFAIFGNQLAMVQHILESDYGIDPEVETSSGATPLLAAVIEGHIDIAKYLINKHKCNVFHKDKRSVTILDAAAGNGHLDILKYLISDKNCDPTAENGKVTSFHVAALNGQVEIINYFITELKISPNIRYGENRSTALHLAARKGHLQLVRYLTRLPSCHCSCVSTNKRTPLHLAAREGKIEIVKYLTITAKCCNHMDEDINGNAPLHLAAYSGHYEVLKFLIEEMHSPPALKNHANMTPLHIALLRGHSKVALYLIVVLYNECRCIVE